MKIFGIEISLVKEKIQPDTLEKRPAGELTSQLERIPRQLRTILMDKGQTNRILTRVQVRLLAKSCGLVVRHYSFFEGMMPFDKIFSLPEIYGKVKVFKLKPSAAQSILGIDESRFIDETGVISSSDMETLKKRVLHRELLVDEEAALFIMAPASSFGRVPRPGLDPIMIEQIDENNFQVVTFWDVPEDVAVYLVSFDQN